MELLFLDCLFQRLVIVETLGSSTESLLARVPLLHRRVEGDEQSASSTSSAVTVRPIIQPASTDGNVEDGVRPHHQREPNTNALPSTTTAAVMAYSLVVSERDAESYFTAHTQSSLAPRDSSPVHETIVETSHAPPVFPAITHFTDTVVAPKPMEQPPVKPLNQSATPTSFELPPRVHRFSLMKGGQWSPLEMIFGSALGTGAKCDLCSKRLGWKPCLECDDCSLTSVIDITFSCFKGANPSLVLIVST